MAGTPTDATRAVDRALKAWRQGDLILDASLPFAHLASGSNPLTASAEETASALANVGGQDQIIVMSDAPGFIVLTQTCDLIRECHDRPMVELAPLITVSAALVDEIRRLKRPNFAYVPHVADQNLVADLERTMTVEKAVLAPLARQPGMRDIDVRNFQKTLARKRQRFAFPDDFNIAIAGFQKRLGDKAGRPNSDEGTHVDALTEIRVTADPPTWDGDKVAITLWLIKSHEPQQPDWPRWITEWVKRFDQAGRYVLDGEPRLIRLEDMRASEYVASHQLDLDHLS